ncbi:MAG TPA: helix-turn-helix domain-containing protein [Candidatus Paceibacterota bacterium]
MAEYNVSLTSKLSRAGLSEKEAQIYAYLIESGGAFPTEIAKHTGLNRTTVYKILEILSIKGIVTELEKQKKFFYQAESPKSLERFVSSQMTMAKRQIESLEQVLPTLEGLFNASPNKPIVRFFEGEEGVLNVYRDHVEGGKSYEMLSFSNTADLMKFITPEFRDDYIRKKAKIGITTRAVLPDTELDVDYNETIYVKFPKNIWPEIKNITSKDFPFKSDLTIYSTNKVSIINFNEPKLAGTIIEDQIVHDMMKMIFELAWLGAGEKDKKIT